MMHPTKGTGGIRIIEMRIPLKIGTVHPKQKVKDGLNRRKIQKQTKVGNMMTVSKMITVR